MKKIIVFLLAVLIVVGGLVAIIRGQKNKEQVEIMTVRGNSLSGVAEEGQEILVKSNLENLTKGDLVVVNYSGNDAPLIKIVKAVPGDRFSLKENNGAWQIIVNDEVVKNSRGEAYRFDEARTKLLKLYVDGSGGIIPKDDYLVLGNLETGSLDSSAFGLINKKEILGQAVIVKNNLRDIWKK